MEVNQGEKEVVWLKNPKALFQSFRLIPTKGMTQGERLNALTRLLLLITVILYCCGYSGALTILIIGLIVVIIVSSYQKNSEVNRGGISAINEYFTPEVNNQQALDTGIREFIPGYDSRPHVLANQPCWFNQNVGLRNAALEITPPIQFNHFDDSKRSYANAKYELIPQTDTDGFRQIWRASPEMCGGYSMIPDPQTVFPVENLETRGQCNYIVRSNIDHLGIPQETTDFNSVRAYAEKAFEDSVLNFRSQLIGEHIDRFRRERQHNCPDMKLLSTSAGAGGSI